MTATTHTTSTVVPNGIYCFHIRTTSELGGTADGPGLTALVDTENPAGTLAVAPMAPGNIVTGSVNLSGTSVDSVSGVESSTYHVATGNACPSGAVVGPTWDTTTAPNGPIEICNVIVDNAGHVAVISITVTVVNRSRPWTCRSRRRSTAKALASRRQ